MFKKGIIQYQGCLPNGTLYTTFCSDCDYYYRYNNGTCGYYDTLVGSAPNTCNCGTSCGPTNGTLTSTFCDGCDYTGVYSNGVCGSYQSVIEYNSCQYCSCCNGLYISLSCSGDSYICVSGPCGSQDDDDSAGGLQPCVSCNSHGSYSATAGAYSSDVSGCYLQAGTSGCNSSDVYYSYLGTGTGRCSGGSDGFSW